VRHFHSFTLAWIVGPCPCSGRRGFLVLCWRAVLARYTRPEENRRSRESTEGESEMSDKSDAFAKQDVGVPLVSQPFHGSL